MKVDQEKKEEELKVIADNLEQIKSRLMEKTNTVIVITVIVIVTNQQLVLLSLSLLSL